MGLILFFPAPAGVASPAGAQAASLEDDVTFSVFDTVAQAHLMAMHDCGKAGSEETAELWQALAALRRAYGRKPPPPLHRPYWASKQDREPTLAEVASSARAQLGCGEKLLKKAVEHAGEVNEAARRKAGE